MAGLISVQSQLNLRRDYAVTMDDIDCRVYEGVCGGIPTKWVVKGDKWDFRVRFVQTSAGLVHMDSNNREIRVYELGDEEWDSY